MLSYAAIITPIGCQAFVVPIATIALATGPATTYANFDKWSKYTVAFVTDKIETKFLWQMEIVFFWYAHCRDYFEFWTDIWKKYHGSYLHLLK